MNNWIKNWGTYILFMFVGAAALLLINNIINVFKSDQTLSNAYVAIGTVFLAIATFFLAYYTKQSISNLDKREKQNRKERIINEIIEWANLYLIQPENQYRIPMINSIGKTDALRYFRAFIQDVIVKLKGLYGRNLYSEKIAAKVDNELYICVNNAINYLNKYVEFLEKWREDLDKDINKNITEVKDAQTKEADKYLKQLAESAGRVIEKAAILKTTEMK